MKTIACPKCGGKGTLKFPEELQSVLEVIPKTKVTSRGITAEEILEQLDDDITSNAVSNRLRRLLDMGAVQRARFGRYWKYTK